MDFIFYLCIRVPRCPENTMKSQILHTAVVTRCEPSAVSIDIFADRDEACAGCRLASMCSPERLSHVDVAVAPGVAVSPGDKVVVAQASSSMRVAMLVLIFIPIVVFVAAVVAMSLAVGQGVAFLSGLACLALYYFCFAMFHSKSSGRMGWTIIEKCT